MGSLYEVILDDLSNADLISELLETDTWKYVDPDTIPELRLSRQDLENKVIDKRFNDSFPF